MVNAINTATRTPSTFIVNKYDDIDGSAVAQSTARGRLCFRDATGRMVLPRTLTEAKKAVFPVDWHMPLNPGPYYNGVGLNGTSIYPFSDGSIGTQENTFTIDPDVAFQTPWPAGITAYEIPLRLYNLPLVSGNMCLVYDEGTVTYGSGNYSGIYSDFGIGSLVYADYSSGNEGKITVSGAVAANTVIGQVEYLGRFGQNTITIKLNGRNALTS